MSQYIEFLRYSNIFARVIIVIDKGLEHLTIVLYFQNVIFKMFHKK